MIKSFNPDLVVVATVEKRPTDVYFYVRNGDPTQILCHKNGGGYLKVTPGGDLVIRPEELDLPNIGDKVVLIRESSCANHGGYNRAAKWAPYVDWEEARWAVYARTTFRMIAYDHRVDGKFNPNSKKEICIIEAPLSEIIKKFPRTGLNEPLGDSYSTSLGGKTLTYKVRRERQCPEGWVECGDPRP